MKNLLKTFACFLCALLMVFGVALADEPSLTVTSVAQGSWSAPFNHNIWKHLLTVNLSQNAKVNATVYDANGVAFITPKVSGEYTANLAASAGSIQLDWPAVNYNGWHPGAGTYTEFTVVVSAENENGSTVIREQFPFHFAHTFEQHEVDFEVDPNAPVDPNQEGEPIADPACWYPNNTVCSFGPHFRDVTPSLTDEWYMFTALDLSQNGVQTYEMVAGNVFIIGNVTITVDGDEVTVHYEYVNDKIMDKDHFFTFFQDYDSITTVNPGELTAWEYDKTYSIANDLGGDTSVLLFTCNEVTFRDDNPGIVRFWENIEWRKTLREHMLTMIGK